jgi:WD40 repeat protein
VWNSSTGEAVAGPFTGHTDMVLSVAHSPDGQHIASGSFDHTIRIWDAATGEVVVGPLTEHTDAVRSVVFSLGLPLVQMTRRFACGMLQRERL